MSVTDLPPAVTSAATSLGVRVESIAPLGGLSGQSWSCGEHVLRLGEVEQLRRETVAMAAASSVVPVPDVHEVAEFVDPDGRVRGALLLERMPGRPAADASHRSSDQMRRIGEACGAVHARLATAAAPDELPLVIRGGAAAWPDEPSSCVLLHLDLHPLNVLVDEHGQVSGVIDWANVARGPEELDRARTWSILTFDPEAARLCNSPGGAALVDGWSAAAGWAGLPSVAVAWSCDYLLDDLAHRPATDALQHARRRLERARLAGRAGRPRS